MGWDLDAFVRACRSHLGAPDAAERIAKRIGEVVVDGAGLAAALGRPDESVPFGDMALHRSPDLTVLHVALPVGMKSPPHDHTMWAAIGLYGGQEVNTLFRREGGKLVEAGERALRPGDTMVLEPDAIHAIRAPVEPGIRALHVYGGDLFAAERRVWHPVTREESVLTLERMREYTRLATQGGVSG